MRTELETVEGYEPVEPNVLATSTEWTPTNNSRSELAWPIFLGAGVAALLLAGTTASGLEALRFDRQKPIETATTPLFDSEEVGRRISRTEALAASRAILERAEHERLQLARNEARVGIQWEG